MIPLLNLLQSYPRSQFIPEMNPVLLLLLAAIGLVHGAPESITSFNSLLHSGDLIPPQHDTFMVSGSDYTSTILIQLKSMLDDPVTLSKIYDSYLTKYNKGIRQSESKFAQNLFSIASHNLAFQTGHSTWTKGVNQFTDMSDEELMHLSGAAPAGDSNFTGTQFSLGQLKAPSAVDWRQQNYVTPIKNQGDCGSCWAFSSVAVLESKIAQVNGRHTILSEQEMVDCDKNNKACQYGWIEKAFDYLQKRGVMTESDYPYRGNEGGCQRGQNRAAGWIGSYSQVSGESQIRDTVAQFGMVSIGVDMHSDFYSYNGGIYNGGCGGKGGHFMAIAGYGSENGYDYWIIKNSWGNRWGESGYMRMIRGYNKCRIGTRNGGWFISQ